MPSRETSGPRVREHPQAPPGPWPGIPAARWTRRLAGGLLAIAFLGSWPLAQPARAADPQPSSPPPRTCADRFPADGPGGVDLQLGCIAAEIVASATGSARPVGRARISEWILPIGGALGGLLLLAWLTRALHGRLNRRLAPAEPATWWVCPGCRSLNPGPGASCYACGTRRNPDAVTIETGTGRLRAPLPPDRVTPGEPPDS